MKKIFNIPTSVWSAAILSLAMVSCSEDILDDINKDNNHTVDAPGRFIIADVITATAFNNVGGDINTYTSTYIEHEVGVDNQLLRAEQREGEPTASTTFNNVWGTIYVTLKNAKIVAEKGATIEEDDLLVGVGNIMTAYNLALLTDMFGDTPWTQACDREAYMAPEFDKQEDIYADVMDMLDVAITALETSPANTLGEYDFLYGGDADQWLKFAYGLKARYTMRLMKRSADVDADMTAILSYVDQSFASAADEASFNIYDASNLNPSFDFQWSRDGLSASQSMFDKLKERNDPRANRIYYDCNSWSHYIESDVDDDGNQLLSLAENGVAAGGKYYYCYTVYNYAQTASTLLMSYHELMFLKAEALCRLGREAEAVDPLKAAIAAAFVNTENSVDAALAAPAILEWGGLYDGHADTILALSATDAENYYTTSVAPLFAANALKEVMNQKYIALWGGNGESTEAYNDVRRMKALGEDFIELKHPKADKFPLRCPYGADDTTTNPNAKKAYGDGRYVYTENVWWAGGSR